MRYSTMVVKRLKEAVPYIFIFGISFFMFRGIFASGFMSGYDNSFHYYQAYYLANTLIPQYHWINGWSMWCLAGFPILVDYCQVGFWLIVCLNKILFLPLVFSYKTMVLFSYIVFGAAFYRISCYRFGKMASLFACAGLMLQKNIYHDKILNGMWNNYLAAGIFFVFFHELDKSIETMTIKKAAILALLLGILILTHLHVAFFAFILLFIYVAPYLREIIKKKKLFLKHILFYFCIPTIAFMIAAYYLRNFIISRTYFTEMGAKEILTGLIWTVKCIFGPLERGINPISSFLLNIPIIIRVIFSFFGIYIFFREERNMRIRRFLMSAITFIFISLVLFSDILPNLFSWWHAIPFMGKLQTNRFHLYAQIGMYLFAAYGIAKFLRHFRKKQLMITTCFATCLLFSVFFHYVYFAHNDSQTLEESPEMSNIYKVWDWVKKNVPSDGTRVIYQNTLDGMDDPILGRSDVFALSYIFTGVPQMDVSPFPEKMNIRTSRDSIFNRKIDLADAVFIKDTMNYLNSGYIVSMESVLRRKLNESKFFIKEEDFGDFSIFRMRDFKSRWVKFKKDSEYKTVLFENQRLIFDLWNKSAYNEALVKVAYHPLWRAYLNNKPVEIKQDKYDMMKIFLPEKGNYKLELVFSSFSYPWVAVSLLGLIICAVVIVRRKS